MQLFIMLINLLINFSNLSKFKIQFLFFTHAKYRTHYELINIMILQQINMLYVNIF
jgi:hypothetical protein